MTLKYIRVYAGFGWYVCGGGGSSATLGQYKLFTLHPVCDIIRKAWREERMVVVVVHARCMRDDTHAHTRVSIQVFTLCPIVVRRQPARSRSSLLDAYSNRFVYAVAADRTPQARENSLKILDIYSYNLHVITLERRVCTRVARFDPRRNRSKCK